MRPTVFLAALCAVLLASNVDARPKHHSLQKTQRTNLQENFAGCSVPVMRPCGLSATRESRQVRRLVRQVGRSDRQVSPRTPPVGLRRVMADGAGMVVGGRPAGCPRRYCGCGASLYLFGKIIPSLNLAANWFRFPRTSPAPGMVAVRRHHVFVLKRHVRGKIWHVFDANSGGGKTRLHNRSIVGFSIVNPHGASRAHVVEARPQWQF
ncbi:conserved hypothetical protein [Nitrobacter hamburgensis X14]|uniref:Uncharacterized protein n=1 Tax=Nitrobacter hamburgensis (strain DSM 10229 / NCIMB 13809 / X14) TaxID=323097 RepID=Q1QKU2_NITHX|nr:hypothetical protein [Nitrobacter hamburgensis]ABE63155.1 conserved hypothetical protein [Nitrobacter hamburgensis X14]